MKSVDWLGMIAGFGFIRQAKPRWDFMTDEVQFRCLTDTLTHSHGNDSHGRCRSADQLTPQTQEQRYRISAVDEIPQVTRAIYAQRAQPPGLTTSELEQMVWYSRKSGRKRTSLLEKKRFTRVRSQDNGAREQQYEGDFSRMPHIIGTSKPRRVEGDVVLLQGHEELERTQLEELEEDCFTRASPQEKAEAQKDEVDTETGSLPSFRKC